MIRILLSFFWCLVATGAYAAPSLVSGPMLGHVTMRTAAVWLQADGAGTAQLEYWKADDPKAKQRTASIDLPAATDFRAIFDLVGLEPGARYEYRVLLDGRAAEVGERLFMRT
ncbi:MAG: fibronectin type III domain-containing protein, partial [Burkholderiales bacterium]